jgi:electron transfer flavoprotein alpha/beta subunit
MLEQLLALKKSLSCRVIGVTMGPKGCLESAQRFIAMGLDDIYIISDPCFAGSDTYSTSYTLFKAFAHIGQADIYAFGEKAIDGETGQVPIGVSSFLNLPCYTGAEKITVNDDNQVDLACVCVDRIETIEIACPFAVCFRGFRTKEFDVSLLQLKRSRNHLPIILNAASFQIDKQQCGQIGSKTKVVQITNVVHKRHAELIEGSLLIKANILKKLICTRDI